MGPDHASQLTVPSSLNQMTQQNAICKGLFHATAVAQINTLLLQPLHQPCMAPYNTSHIGMESIHVVLLVLLYAACGSVLHPLHEDSVVWGSGQPCQYTPGSPQLDSHVSFAAQTFSSMLMFGSLACLLEHPEQVHLQDKRWSAAAAL